MFFTNSGTEANELAMMIARLYTGCHDIISLRNAYHGNGAGTMGANAQSNWKFNVVQVMIFLQVIHGFPNYKWPLVAFSMLMLVL